MSSASDDLIGFNATIEPTATSSSRSSSNIDLFGLDSLQPVLVNSMQQQPRPQMSAMGGMVRPATMGGSDPFSGLTSNAPRGPPTNPYQQPRPPIRPF